MSNRLCRSPLTRTHRFIGPAPLLRQLATRYKACCFLPQSVKVLTVPARPVLSHAAFGVRERPAFFHGQGFFLDGMNATVSYTGLWRSRQRMPEAVDKRMDF